MTIKSLENQEHIQAESLPPHALLVKKAQQEAWYRGNLTWKLHSGQKLVDAKFKSILKQLYVCNISRQWGKSYWAVTKAIEQAIKKPKSQIRYVAAFHSDLVEFIIPAFDKIIEDCPLKLKPKFKKVGSFYIFPNGSKIKLIGCDRNPNSIRGNTLDLIILDECGYISNLDYLYKSVIIPATTHRPNCKVIMISTPPATPAHPFADFCQKADIEGAYSKFTIYDNPLIDGQTIARLMEESGGAHTSTWKREYLCEFVTDDNLAIVSEWKDEFAKEIPRDQYYGYYHKYVGLDLGVKDFTAGIFGYYDFKRAALVIEDEFHTNGEAGLNTEVIANTIKAKETELWGTTQPFRRVADNNWPLLIADFSSLHNLTFIATNKDTLEAMINELRIMVKNGRILVNPKCKFLLGCLKYGVWDKKKKKFARSTVYGHFDHLAALIYLVRNLAQHTNPIPVDHGFQNHTAWLGNIKHQMNASNNARAVFNALIPKRKPNL